MGIAMTPITIITTITATPTHNMTSLLHLLHLVSPALPVGAYAYSQGLEYAIDSGWVGNTTAVEDWLSGIMTHSLATTDLPILLRCYNAWQQDDIQQVYYWNRYLRACRETRELLMEDEQLGQALWRLLSALGLPQAQQAWPQPPCFACLFALAGSYWQIPLAQLMEGFVWSWLENQVAAATKLVPLGQTQAQQLLLALMPQVSPSCQAAQALSDDDIGQGLPGLAMASSLHETQYSRLFRS